MAIVAEIPQEDLATFWDATLDSKRVALQWLAVHGAQALVTREVPSPALSQGWIKVGTTNYYILMLPAK